MTVPDQFGCFSELLLLCRFQVSSTLNDLDSFLKRIEPGIEAITGEEQDIASFMRLMRVFNEVGMLGQQQTIWQSPITVS